MGDFGVQLRALRPEDGPAFCRAVRETREADIGFEFAFHFDPAAPFRDYLGWLAMQARGEDLPEKHVPSTYLVGVAGGEIVGRVSIRHALNDFLSRIGGHIGYGVVPSCQGRGYATTLLRLALPVARDLGLHHILVTCDVDNLASRRVIEKNGGVFERISNEPELTVQKRRYWIDLSASRSADST